MNMASLQRHGLTYKQVVFFDEDTAHAVWDQTMAEAQSGVLEGPLNLEDISYDTPLSRRFGVKQGPKTRCVDDFNGSGANATAQVAESPKPHTFDVVGGMLAAVMNKCPNSVPWLSRSFDLKSVY